MNWKFWKIWKKTPELPAPKKVVPLPLDAEREAQRDVISQNFKGLLLKFKHSASHIKEDIAIVNHDPSINVDVRQFTLGKKTDTHIIIATLSVHALRNDKITTQIQKGNKKHEKSNKGREHTPGRDRGGIRETGV